MMTLATTGSGCWKRRRRVHISARHHTFEILLTWGDNSDGKVLACKHEDLGSVPPHPCKRPAVVLHTCHHCAGETKAKVSLSTRWAAIFDESMNSSFRQSLSL